MEASSLSLCSSRRRGDLVVDTTNMGEAAASAKRCAVCAMVLSLVCAALVGVGIVIGGSEHLGMKAAVHDSVTAQAALKSDQAHLAAQLTQVRQVDTGLGARLQTAEAALAALQASVSSKRGSGDGLKASKGKRRGSKEETAAAPSPASGKDGGQETSGGGSSEADKDKDSKDDDDDDDDKDKEQGKGKGKGKGRKGKRRGRGRR